MPTGAHVRLERARDDLRSPRDSDTVTTIAYRWGFGHTGRFARRIPPTLPGVALGYAAAISLSQ